MSSFDLCFLKNIKTLKNKYFFKILEKYDVFTFFYILRIDKNIRKRLLNYNKSLYNKKICALMELRVQKLNEYIKKQENITVNVFSTNYNILRYRQGMQGMLFYS